MNALLLVIGSLVPASDSPELTTTPSRPSAVGAVVDVRKLIKPDMTKAGVSSLLGNPDRINYTIVGVLIESWEYEKLGFRVQFVNDTVLIAGRLHLAD